jgi:hypothetical protein
LSQKGYFNKIEQEKAYQKWQKKWHVLFSLAIHYNAEC